MTGFRCFQVSLLLCAFIHHVSAQTGPNYCSYASGLYTCDYSSMSTGDRPIDFTQFSVQPQQLVVTVNGYMPYISDTRSFSETFSTIDKTTFDENYPATLTLDCGWSGQLYFADGAFYNMSYVQHMKIRNCVTYFIPASAFESLQDLDYFGFEGGIIDDMDPNGMAGLNVEKLITDTHQIPRNLGHFEVLYTKFSSGSIPPGLMFNWKNLTSATIRGADVSSVTADVFKYNIKLRYIDLSDNTFTSLPGGLLSGLESLSDLQLYNIDWQCSCDNLWFIGYARDNNITLFGDLMCSNQQGQTVKKYYYDNCEVANICDGLNGFEFSGRCLTYLSLGVYITATLALLFNVTGLILTIIAMRNIAEPEDPKAALKAMLKRSREVRYMWKKAGKKIINALRLQRETESPEDFYEVSNNTPRNTDYQQGMYSNNRDASSYNQGMYAHNQGMYDYNQGMSGNNQGMNDYNQGIPGNNQGMNDYNQGISGYNQGISGYNQGMNDYNQGMNDYNQGIYGNNQATHGFNPGMLANSQDGRPDYSQGMYSNQNRSRTPKFLSFSKRGSSVGIMN